MSQPIGPNCRKRPPNQPRPFPKERTAVNHGTEMQAAAKLTLQAEAEASEAMSACAALRRCPVFAHRRSFTDTVPERRELLSPFRGFLRHCFDFTADASSRGRLQLCLAKISRGAASCR